MVLIIGVVLYHVALWAFVHWLFRDKLYALAEHAWKCGYVDSKHESGDEHSVWERRKGNAILLLKQTGHL